MKNAILIAILVTPSLALADVTVTPTVQATAKATDNSGMRSEEQGRRGDAIGDVSAGASILWSRPTFAIRTQALGEYERYLSAAVRNTYAAGGLDGKWRPDERTTVRGDLGASYSPDRYDPRVPYRLAVSALESGEAAPAFVRANTAKVRGYMRGERWVSETFRTRLAGEYVGYRFSERRAVGTDVGLPPRSLENRDVVEIATEALKQVSEPGALGGYALYGRADYESGPTVHRVESGVTTEWEVTERWSFEARAGASWMRAPEAASLPTRLGWNARAGLTRMWLRGELEASVREGVYMTSGALPAAQRREGRLSGVFRPWERLETRAFVAMAREKSLYSAYRATGRYDLLAGGASLGFRTTERSTVSLGWEHARLVSTGLVEFPYTSNTVWLGFTFTGGPFGDPPVTP